MANLQPMLRQWIVLRTISARRHGATVRELIGETGASDKCIRRDLKVLADAGFPLDDSSGPHGRKHWKLAVPDGCPPLPFTYTEAMSLYMGRRFLEPLAGTEFWNAAQSAFRKIRATLGDTAVAYLEKFAPLLHCTAFGTGDYTKKGEIIDTLMIGLEDRRFTSIAYQSGQATEPATRDVYPYGMVWHNGSLYLVAFAPEHDEIRHYKVDRIEAADTTDLRFNKPADFDLSRHLSGSLGIWHGRGDRQVRIRFAPTAARYVEEGRWHPSQHLTRHRDGSLTADFRLAALEEVTSWVLSFGAQAEVLEPKELRQEITEELKQLLEVYTPGGQNGRSASTRRRRPSADHREDQ